MRPFIKFFPPITLHKVYMFHIMKYVCTHTCSVLPSMPPKWVFQVFNYFLGLILVRWACFQQGRMQVGPKLYVFSLPDPFLLPKFSLFTCLFQFVCAHVYFLVLKKEMAPNATNFKNSVRAHKKHICSCPGWSQTNKSILIMEKIVSDTSQNFLGHPQCLQFGVLRFHNYEISVC